MNRRIRELDSAAYNGHHSAMDEATADNAIAEMNALLEVINGRNDLELELHPSFPLVLEDPTSGALEYMIRDRRSTGRTLSLRLLPNTFSRRTLRRTSFNAIVHCLKDFFAVGNQHPHLVVTIGG